MSIKIVFYCQYLHGLGHLSRSLNLCEEFVKEAEVHFIQGGPDVGRTINHDNFHHYFLSPILLDTENETHYSLESDDLESVLEQRKSDILRPPLEKTHFLIIELFPFGRRKFSDEIRCLIDEFRNKNPTGLVICALRDILSERQDQDCWESKVVTWVQRDFDYVWVHSDQNLIPLDKTFKSVSLIKEKIYYTGFVSKLFNERREIKKEKTIVVSVGSGLLCHELLMKVASIVESFPSFTFKFFTGPHFPKEKFNILKEQIERSSGVVNYFSGSFQEELQKASLSISLGGYNTIMDILSTKVSALVYCFNGDREQGLRAHILESKNYLKVLQGNELDDKTLLIEKMREALSVSPYEKEPQLFGQKVAFKHLKLLMDKQK